MYDHVRPAAEFQSSIPNVGGMDVWWWCAGRLNVENAGLEKSLDVE